MTRPAPASPRRKAASAAVLALAASLAAGAAGAETPVSPDEFDRLTAGRTVHWTALGRPYGTEQYLPGRQVLWAVEGGDCQRGRWWAKGAEICFSYEGDPAPKCWTITREAQKLAARPVDDPGGIPLIAASDSDRPLACRGPRVGV